MFKTILCQEFTQWWFHPTFWITFAISWFLLLLGTQFLHLPTGGRETGKLTVKRISQKSHSNLAVSWEAPQKSQPAHEIPKPYHSRLKLDPRNVCEGADLIMTQIRYPRVVYSQIPSKCNHQATYRSWSYSCCNGAHQSHRTAQFKVKTCDA